MNYLYLIILVLASIPTWADTYLVVAPDSTFFRTANPNVIRSFDKDFFLPKDTPKLSSGKNGDSRYYGQSLAYNSAQRETWSEKCESEKQKGMAYFRKCFREEQRRNQEELDKSIDAINARSNQPFKSVPANNK